jgi:osmotically-inducible protein OsmY
VRVPRGVRADVSSGVVRLHGVVQRSTQRDVAEDAVRHLVGLRGISNEIKVVPAEVAVDLERQIEAALDRRFDGDARSISVSAAEGVVTLRGAVPSFALRDDIERTVRCAPGVTRVDDQLQIG